MQVSGHFEQRFILILSRLFFSLGGGPVSMAHGHLAATF